MYTVQHVGLAVQKQPRTQRWAKYFNIPLLAAWSMEMLLLHVGWGWSRVNRWSIKGSENTTGQEWVYLQRGRVLGRLRRRRHRFDEAANYILPYQELASSLLTHDIIIELLVILSTEGPMHCCLVCSLLLASRAIEATKRIGGWEEDGHGSNL